MLTGTIGLAPTVAGIVLYCCHVNFLQIKFNSDLHDFVKRHKPEDHVNDGIMLQPLAEMHFDARFGNFNGRVISKKLISTLFSIALFLLIIACVNFINLATAQAVNRSREVGIRKVLGGRRSQLVVQFLSEAGMITVLAVMLATGLAKVTLPLLNKLLQISLTLNVNDPQLLLFLLLLILCVTVYFRLLPCSRILAF